MICKLCNKQFDGNEKRIYCSVACSAKTNAKSCIGVKPPNFKNILGSRIGRLSVIEETRKSKKLAWICKCDCGNTITIFSYKLSGKSPTQSCGCLRTDSIRDRSKKYHEEISGTYWGNLKRGASIRGIEFNLTIEYAYSLYLQQDKKCKLSGIELNFGLNGTQTASLDRIDSSQNYIEGNVQWVHKDINRMKNDLDNESFIQYCKLIAFNN